MSRIGKNLLVRSDYRSVADELDAIAAVRAEEVAALAGRLLTQPLTAAVVGPYAAQTDLPEQLLAMVRPGSIGTGGQRRHVG
jgi:predicted Zn-dependent peptidase